MAVAGRGGEPVIQGRLERVLRGDLMTRQGLTAAAMPFHARSM
jgi:hypothetical protein